MGYWKAKVLPKIKLIFDKNGPKRQAAAEASKVFDEAKEQYSNEFEEKKAELQPKVVEIYEAAPAEIKALVKEPKEAGLKKHSTEVQKFLDELVKIEFPGSKAVSEASREFGASYVSGPVSFVLEKVCTFVVTEDKKEEAVEGGVEAATETEEAAISGTVDEVKDKEITVEAVAAPAPEAAKVEEAASLAAPAPATAPAPAPEAAKVEEAAAPVASEPPKA